MIELVDFNHAPRLNRFYGGNAGRKIAVEYQEQPWIIKFPESTAGMQGRVASYTTSPVSEYLGSHIYSSLGLPVHDTLLGFRDGKVVVACRDFTYPNRELIEFKNLKNSISDDFGSGFSGRPSDGSNVTMSDVLCAITELDNVYDAQVMLERFWDMFVVDAFIGNKDRNNGNWGLLAENGKIIGLAPVYDNGNSFFNKRRNSINARRLEDDSLIAQDSIGTVTSVYLKDDGHHVMPFKYMSEGIDEECNAALGRFAEKLDMNKILDIVDSLPSETLNFTIVQPETKEFMKRMLIERFAKGFVPVLRELGILEARHEQWLANYISKDIRSQ